MRILFTTIALLLLNLLNASAQRKLPYPIILIHGFSGGSSNWSPMKQYLANQLGLSIEGTDLSYCLNADGNPNTSNKYKDVYLYGNNIGSSDVYTVNFDVCPQSTQSNQSGAVKQGYALGFAIAAVLRATGAQKVILFGHSMGGLAAREYLQNSENWPPDRQHHVAKLITLGTPHLGSNLGSGDLNLGSALGYDEASEAVRDLRTSYKSGSSGVYLFGGYESASVIQRGFGSLYYNIDVNSNGYSGDLITGLNQKNIRNDLAFSCVVGTGVLGLNGDSDGVVLSASQDLNKLYKIGADVFYYRCPSSVSYSCHTGQPDKAIFENLYALDEPANSATAYQIELNKTYQGTFTLQSDQSFEDRDRYRVNIAQRGRLKISANAHPESNAKIEIRDPSNVLISSTPNSAQPSLDLTLNYNGDYLIDFTGSPGSGWRGYGYSTSFCPLPPVPTLAVSGPTTFCEGQTVLLSTGPGYDEYRWYRNGQLLPDKSSRISVGAGGEYKVQGMGCGLASNSVGAVTFTVNPAPPKTLLKMEVSPDSVLLTTNGTDQVSWYRNGSEIAGANATGLLVEMEGLYHSKATRNGCSSFSDSLSVKIEKPILFSPTPASVCEGDSLLLTAPAGFGTYIFSNGTKEVSSLQNTFFVKSSGSYFVRTLRGKLSSVASDPVNVVLVTLPPPAAITVDGKKERCANEAAITLIATPGYDDYQWFRNDVPMSEKGQTIKDQGPGQYRVQGVKCGRARALGGGAMITVYPLPAKPTLSRQDLPDAFLLTSTSSENVQWFRNGVLLPGVKSEAYTPTAFGDYFVEISRNGCTSRSDAVSVSIGKPLLFTPDSTVVCQGDSIRLVAPAGYGMYVFSDGQTRLSRKSNTLTVGVSGLFSVETRRGELSSVASDPVEVTVNQKPEKPTISLDGFRLMSSSVANNQWYLDGKAIPDSTRQHLASLGGGAYIVRVTKQGCHSDSEPFLITALPQALKSGLNVYPNPTAIGTAWVDLPQDGTSWQLRMYDMLGKAVGNQALNGLAPRPLSIKTPRIAAAYILLFTSDTGLVYRATLIVQ